MKLLDSSEHIYERGLPANVDAERYVIAAVLRNACEYLATMREIIGAEDFSLMKHRMIFACACELWDEGSKVDRVSVAERLHRHKKLEACDGITYLISLEDGMPDLVGLEEWARIVRDKSILRQTLIGCQSLAQRVMAGDLDSSQGVSEAEAMLRSLQSKISVEEPMQTPGDVIMSAGGVDDYLSASTQMGLPTPWRAVNEYTWGMQPEDVWVLGAGTSIGKTAFSIQIALHAAMRGWAVPFFGLEMSRQQYTNRLIQLCGNLTRDQLKARMPLDRPAIMAAMSEVFKLPIYFRDQNVCTVPGIQMALRKLRSKGLQFGVVVVDYLQLLEPAGRFSSREQAVTSLIWGLKTTAVEFHVPVLVLAQVNREPGREGRRPALYDLRESGRIEQDASVVMFLHSSESISASASSVVEVEWILAKQRNGPRNVSLKMQFRKDIGRFEIPMEADDGQAHRI